MNSASTRSCSTTGVVLDVTGAPGEFFDEKPILEVAQLDPLRIEAFLPVDWIGRVEKGLTGVVRPQQPVGGSYEAKVTVVDPVVDAASGTFRVRLELPNPDRALAAGLQCELAFPSLDVPVAVRAPAGLGTGLEVRP